MPEITAPVATKVPPRPEMNDEIVIRKIPQKGEVFKSKNFTIRITEVPEQGSDEYMAEIIGTLIEERYPLGKTFGILEIAFQSDYYSSTM